MIKLVGKMVESEARAADGNDIRLVEVLQMAWKSKFRIAAFSLATALLGAGYAIWLPPMFRAEAIIAPKEGAKVSGASAMLSQLGGGLGGMMAAQLGIGGGNLDWIEVMLKGKELAKTVIEKENLLPVLFPKKWDTGKREWKRGGGAAPDLDDGVEALLMNNLKLKKDAKRNLLTFGIEISDSVLSARLVGTYLSELNEKMKSEVQKESDVNRKYLEEQFNKTMDPWLQRKIQELIYNEIERAMVMNAQSFQILEQPAVPNKRSKPNRKMIVLASMMMGLFFGTFAVVLRGILVGSLKPGEAA